MHDDVKAEINGPDARRGVTVRQPPDKLPRVDTSIPTAWDGRVAYVVSQVASPPVLVSLGVVLTASTLIARPWGWAALYVCIAILSPLLYLGWLVRRGQVTDLDVQLREQRSKPLIATLACSGLALLLLLLGGAPQRMVTVAGAVWLQGIAIFLITFRWKISVHAAAAGGISTLIWLLFGTPLLLLGLVPLVAWSRVRLRRHTPAQTIAGALLGIAIFLVLLSIGGG